MVFPGCVPKYFGFSALVAIVVCGFCSISLSVFGKNNIGFLDLLFDAVCCFFRFLFRKICASTACTSSRILLAFFGFDRNLFRFCGFLLLFVRFCGLLYTPMPASRISSTSIPCRERTLGTKLEYPLGCIWLNTAIQ